jgi:hypothetical protein
MHESDVDVNMSKSINYMHRLAWSLGSNRALVTVFETEEECITP